MNATENEDYKWLLSALGGPGAGIGHSVLARPSAGQPELYLPTANRKVSAAALRRYHDGKSKRANLTSSLAVAASSLGMLRFAPGDLTSIGPFAVVDQLSALLQEPDLHVGITLGPRRRNRKPVLQLIRSDGSIVGFAKVGWSPFTRILVANEAAWLQRLEHHLPASIRAPRVISTIDEPDRIVVVTSPLLTSPREDATAGLSNESIVALSRSLGTARCNVADLPHLQSLRSGHLGHAFDLDRFTTHHRGAKVEIGLWHGDLTPWNVSTTGDVSQVWDWEFADENRPVGFDLLHGAFELVRRASTQNEAAALHAVERQTHSILEPLGQPADAVFDLYLCELIEREGRLLGEGWDPADLGPLESHALAMLDRRLP